jgi:SP family myo-inositol transporter-like MFS transporter 13
VYVRRRSAIILSDVVFIAAAAKMAVALSPSGLIRGRALMGVAIGLASIVGPVYIAESAPNSMRATMVVMYSIEIGVGTSLAYTLDFGFTHTHLTWRLMLGISIVPAIIQMVALCLLPESPRWLAQYGRVDEAKETMESLALDPADKERDREELDAVYERAQWLKTPEGQEESQNYRPRELAVQLALGMGLFLMNNFSGECALVYYSIEIIGMAGVVSEGAIAQAIINIGMCATAGVLIGFFMIDRIGRRRLLAISGFGTCASLFLLALSFSLAQSRSPSVLPPNAASLPEVCAIPVSTCTQCLQVGCAFCGAPYAGPGSPTPGLCFNRADAFKSTARDVCAAAGANATSSVSGLTSVASAATDSATAAAVLAVPTPGVSALAPPSPTAPAPQYEMYRQGCPSGWGWLSLLALCSFQFWFQIGLGIVPSAVNAEFYPQAVRGLCNGSAVATSWLGNFCVSSTFLTLVATLGASRTFCINASIVLTGTILTQFFLPETCGLSFAEIQRLFKMYQQPGSPPPWELHGVILRERGDGDSPRGGDGDDDRIPVAVA